MKPLSSTPVRFAALLVLALVATSTYADAATAPTFTAAERESIQEFIDDCVANTKAALVVALVDQGRTTTLAAGTLDNGTDRQPDGDSLFFIGSVSKTFTSLLLLEMASRGEVALDDPLAKYLPSSVDVPEYDGHEITLLHLATNTAGFPINPDNMTGKDTREQYESYTIEKVYDYLSRFKLTRDPGTQYGYSNVGMALLGHALERRAEVPFESLLIERIARPIGMDSTCITLPPELQPRLAMGHDESGAPSPPFKLQAYHPAGDIHSTANDLAKYVAAQAGLKPSPLAPLMEQSHVFRHQDTTGIPGGGSLSLMGRTAMPWVDRGAVQPAGMQLLGHAGGAGSYHAWVGFDKKQHRGVVVLSTGEGFSVEAIGWTILQRLSLTDERKLVFAREIVGIGVALDKQDGVLSITKILPNSPAADAQLTAGLNILQINDVPTAGLSLEKCVDLIRGPLGTPIRLLLTDPINNESKLVVLIRQRFGT